jgi:peptide/nickel transport system substrate-binding protein
MKHCSAFFLCNSENESDAGAPPKPDLAKAKALLKEAGYNGERIVALLPTDRAQYNALMTVLIAELRSIGVNVDVQAADWSTVSIRRAKQDPLDKGGWNLFITTQGGVEATMPATNGWFNSGCDKANNGWACDDVLQQMITRWTHEPDRTKRHAMIPEIQARAYVSIPYLPGGQFFQPIAFRKNVTGALAAGLPVYWNIDKQ